MRARIISIFTVIGVATVLVLAANTVSEAATGHGFLLGRSNAASAGTTLSRTTSGTVLALHSKVATNAPLAVNGTGKVANLNADKLDGLDSSALKTTTYVFSKQITTPTTSASIFATGLPAGTYLVAYSAYLNSSPSAALNDSDCFVSAGYNTTTLRKVGESRGDATAFTAALSGSGVLVKTSSSADNVILDCSAAKPFINASGAQEPFQLTLTRIDTAVVH